MSDKDTVVVMAGGDRGPTEEPSEQFAELIAPTLAQADIRFAQCERSYSERGRAPEFIFGPGGQHSRLAPPLAGAWKAAGIDVVSLASNHEMDWGTEPVLDTIAMFRGMGKHVIGAGSNSDDARKPAVVERN